MIFSQWQPDGGYALYESKMRHPIGDDLPSSPLPRASHLGVPAQDAGFPLPRDARYLGMSDMPEGVMAPMARDSGYQSLGQAKTKLSHDEIVVVLALIGVFFAGAFAGRKGRK